MGKIIGNFIGAFIVYLLIGNITAPIWLAGLVFLIVNDIVERIITYDKRYEM